jgi:hypothetical protein
LIWPINSTRLQGCLPAKAPFLPFVGETAFGVFKVLALRCETVSLGNSDGFPGGAELRNSCSFGLLEHPEKKAAAKIRATIKCLVRAEQEFNIEIPMPRKNVAH